MSVPVGESPSAGPRILPLGHDAVLVECATIAEVQALAASLRRDPLAGVTQIVPAARTVALFFGPYAGDIFDGDVGDIFGSDVARAIRAEIRAQMTRVTGVNDAANHDNDQADDAATVADDNSDEYADDGQIGTPVLIEVVYDGPDLAPVAARLGMSPDALIDLHAAGDYTVAFNGFAPGFPYLSGLPEALQVPRLATPRPRVPRGSVAIAGEFCGIYPVASPGGWHLLGTTAAVLWDSTRQLPPLLPAGTGVRFVPVRAKNPLPISAAASTEKTDEPVGLAAAGRQVVPGAVTSAEKPVEPVDTGRSALVVDDPGPLTVLVDDGRPGHLAWAVSPGGAADATALHAANRLVGNPPGAVALESLGGLALTAQKRCVVGIGGARVSAEVNDSGVDTGAPILLAAGEQLTVSLPTAGARIYIALRGGIAAHRELGSASFDALSDLGTAPVMPGQELRADAGLGLTAVESGCAVGPELPVASPSPLRSGRAGQDDLAMLAATDTTRALPITTLALIPGPRADWITAEAHSILTSQIWQVSPDSNRVGIRLLGAMALARIACHLDMELPSEALVAGAIQVPPSGQPLIFGTNHPTTGGYPVIACVAPQHLRLIGQLPTGAAVRFVWEVSPYVLPATGSLPS